MIPPKSVTDGLPTELIEYIIPCELFSWRLHHPLIIEEFLSNEVNKHWATAYSVRKKHVEDLIDNGDLKSAIFFFQRPFRFEAYLQHVHGVSDLPVQAEILLDVWVDSEDPYVNRECWDECFRQLREQPALCDSIGGLEFPLEIYRGFSVSSDCDDLTDVAMSLSWTTCRAVAEKFASMNRTGTDARYVASTTIQNSELIYAYTDCRSEKEVIVSLDIADENVSFEII
jgi:hypothetical protein